MLLVQKYGGTSVGNAERMRRAACRAAALAGQGVQLVMVVSAQGDTTDELLVRGMQVNPHPPRRELDAYLSTGEQMSAALIAMTLAAQGVDAVSLTGWQAGIHTDADFGNARISRIDTASIRRELDAGRVVVVAGFQGIEDGGSITTLGRGGSDTTAVALAAALLADRCVIYTDVDGVYDRDPRKYPDAVRFERIGYEDMLVLAQNGAQVLHDRCIELAQKTGILIEVRSAFTDAPGTLVC